MSKIYFVEITTPTPPSTGKVILYAKPDGFLYSLDEFGVETKLSNSPDTGITDLSGDVSASGPGFAVATVNSVGGKTASQIASSITDTVNATSSNTINTIVKRDASGNFSASTITASLTGAASLNVLKSGDTMSGVLNMGSNKITNLAAPTLTTDATTKTYVDSGLALKFNNAFTPTTPSDWTIVPTLTQQAIDYLAANQKSNIDGGSPTAVFGGTFNIDGGSP